MPFDATRPAGVSDDACQQLIYSPDQAAAIAAIVAWFSSSSARQRRFFLGGYAGSGKSTLLLAIIRALGLTPEEILIVAPTNKAAQVLREKLVGTGFKVATLHAVLLRPSGDATARAKAVYVAAKIRGASEAELKTLRQQIADAEIEFSACAASRLPRLLVFEECSMVGVSTYATAAVDSMGVPVLGIGDPAQLPPVNETAVFTHPDTVLTTIHRQAAGSAIAQLAYRIRTDAGYYRITQADGTPDDAILVIDHRSDAGRMVAAISDIQHIVYSNPTRFKVNRGIRAGLGYHDPQPRPGELLVCDKTTTIRSKKFANCDRFTVENFPAFPMHLPDPADLGPTPRATLLDDDDRSFELECFGDCLNAPYHPTVSGKAYHQNLRSGPLKSDAALCLAFCYAITGHKSQGSEFDAIIVHEYDRRRSLKFSPVTEARSWLYTAVSRARQNLIVLI